MPLGIINSDDFNKELDRFKLPKPSELEINMNDELPDARVIDQSIGRGNKSETPESIRKVIAESAIEGADAGELADTFNVSKSSVSAYKHGSHSTSSYNQPNPALMKHVNGIKDKIVRKANNKMIDALNSITREALAESKPRDLAAIAKDMSSVVKNLTPETNEIHNDVRVVVMAPPMKSINSYDVIEVNE